MYYVLFCDWLLLTVDSSKLREIFDRGVDGLLSEGLHGDSWPHPVCVGLMKGFSDYAISITKLHKEDCWINNNSDTEAESQR